LPSWAAAGVEERLNAAAVIAAIPKAGRILDVMSGG
jgi:hypothetical protein